METVYSEFKENRMNIDDIDTIDLNACTDAELNDLLDQVLIKVDYYKHGVSGAITAALNKKAFDSVKFMRQQRDLLTDKLSKMTKEEIVSYFKKKAQDGVKPSSN